MPGTFIALDGPDGGGKTTQLARLAARLEETGRDVQRVREPGGTPLGERVRAILLGGAPGDVSACAEVFLFMAARAQLVRDVIRPALARGAVVLSDRFVAASVAYQGVAGGLGAGAVESLADVATEGLLPDRTLILDLPPETGLARGTGRGDPDRMEQKGIEYHRRVREGFLDYAKRHPERAVVVDADGTVDEVFARVWDEVADALA